MANELINKELIMKAWTHLRKTEMTIPDETLDFMRNVALEKCAEMEACDNKINKETKAQCAMENVNNSTDFWKDAQEFLKSQLPSDFGEKMKDFAESKQYKQNDFRLFKSMIEDAVGFEANMILLKHYS